MRHGPAIPFAVRQAIPGRHPGAFASPAMGPGHGIRSTRTSARRGAARMMTPQPRLKRTLVAIANLAAFAPAQPALSCSRAMQ